MVISSGATWWLLPVVGCSSVILVSIRLPLLGVVVVGGGGGGGGGDGDVAIVAVDLIPNDSLNKFNILCHFRDKDGDRNPRR